MWSDYSKSTEACQRNFPILEAWFLLFYSKTVEHRLSPGAGGKHSGLCRAAAKVEAGVGRRAETSVAI